MFQVEDILARLQNGENANDIADEMVNALNAANNQFQKEVEAKAKAAEAEAKKTKRLADLQDILDLIHDFCIEHYCDSDEDVDTVETAFAGIDAAAVDQMIEEMGTWAVKMVEIEDQIKNMFGSGIPVAKIKTPDIGKKPVKKKTADTVIADFLKNMGL